MILKSIELYIGLLEFRDGSRFKVYISFIRNTKIEVQPILSYGGSFPSYLVRTVKLRVRISSVTNTAALRRSYRALLILSPQRRQNSRDFVGFSTAKT